MKHLDYLELLTNPLAGGSGGGGSSPTGTVDIVANGTANVAAYAEANVAVPGGLSGGVAYPSIPSTAIVIESDDFVAHDFGDRLITAEFGRSATSSKIKLDVFSTINVGDYVLMYETYNGQYYIVGGTVRTVNQYSTYGRVSFTLTMRALSTELLTISASGYADVRGKNLVNVSAGGGGNELRGLLDGSLAGTLSESTITSLKTYACYALAHLTGVNFPEVTTMGEHVFDSCVALTDVSLPKLTAIPTKAFYGCTALRDNVFPLVKTIGDSAFYNCKALTKVNTTYFPGLNQSGAIISGSAFQGCDHLTEVDLPSALNSLGSSAFNSCSRLAYVKFLGTNIGTGVFQHCVALATLLLPNLTTIGGASAIRECTSLQAIEFPALTSMGTNQYIFRECTALAKVIFHAHLTSVPSYTFQSCSSLKYVLFAGATSVPTLSGTNAFQGTPIASGTGYIYVPDDLLTTWKAASNWSTYANQIKGIKAWTPEAHDVDDIVTSQGHYYLCIASTASTPWMGPGETAYWQDFGVVV